MEELDLWCWSEGEGAGMASALALQVGLELGFSRRRRKGVWVSGQPACTDVRRMGGRSRDGLDYSSTCCEGDA